jgi:hypothetical protein
MLPDMGHFIQLQRTRRPRGGSLIRTPTQLITPSTEAHDRVHIHDPPPAFSNSTDISTISTSKAYRSCDVSYQNAACLIVENGTVNGDDQRHIKVVLDSLHARYPALDYLQYEDRLQEQGICYLIVASMFDPGFYISNVGMAPGAAHLFCRWVVEELRRVA